MSYLKLIQDFYADYAAGNVEKLAVAPNIRHISPMGLVEGKDAFRQSCLQFVPFVKKIEVIQHLEQGNQVAVMTNNISQFGTKSISEWFTIQGGEIAEINSYFDASDMIQQGGTLPVLPVTDVNKVVDFYVHQLGFKEDFRQPSPDGTIVAGQVSMDGSKIMFNLNPQDANKAGGGVYFWFRLQNINIDDFYRRLINQGIQIKDDIQNQYWGDRYFAVYDLNQYILAFNQSIKQ
jgi:uncharacterized glyoxalase superfamily protein PhnB